MMTSVTVSKPANAESERDELQELVVVLLEDQLNDRAGIDRSDEQ